MFVCVRMSVWVCKRKRKREGDRGDERKEGTEEEIERDFLIDHLPNMNQGLYPTTMIKSTGACVPNQTKSEA